MLAKLFRPRPSFSRRPAPAVPPGQRVYAIGDIHGRLDLLDLIIERVSQDDRARPQAATTVIFLGDLIDRGPDSAGVVERLMRLRQIAPEVHVLLGNHEEVFLHALDGSLDALRGFVRIGGRETALSYGVSPGDYEAADYPTLLDLLRGRVPREHVAFLRAAEDMIVIGDYAFVHAGVRPDAPLDAQALSDLRWIRSGFLHHRGTLEKMIVHGHSIAPEVEALPHRIGIDTGAYRTGRLTALGLEGTDRWVLQTEGAPAG